MSWGGRREGAGRSAAEIPPHVRERKSNAETERCRAILDRALSEADWEAIFKNQLRIASTGDGPAAVAAAKFLAHYRWGDPVEPEPEEEHIEPVKLIEVHLDGSRHEVEGWKRDAPQPAARSGQLEKNLNNQNARPTPPPPKKRL